MSAGELEEDQEEMYVPGKDELQWRKKKVLRIQAIQNPIEHAPGALMADSALHSCQEPVEKQSKALPLLCFQKAENIGRVCLDTQQSGKLEGSPS